MSRAARQRRGAGAGVPSAYTRSPMDTSILGSTQQARLEAISDEARAAVEAAAERLQELSGELRAAYGETVVDANSGTSGDSAQPNAEQLGRARVLLGQLELAGQQFRQMFRTADPGDENAGLDSQPSQAPRDPAVATAILAAQEQERSRLAAELHDGPAQALSNAIFQTEIIGHALGDNTRQAEAELQSLSQMLQRELDRLRAYINALRPPLIEPEGLEDGLRESAGELSSRTGIDVDVRIDAPGVGLDESQRAVALRVAQEALRNVGKHALAKRAWLRTYYADSRGRKDREWVLEVGDDGQGFDVAGMTAQSNRRHFGLRFMRERAQLLGAQLSIDANAAAGTVVRLSISTGGERS
jgi:signal transduction histidine kinase